MKEINLTYEEQEEAEAFLLVREQTYTHESQEKYRSALCNARMGVWKRKLAETQAYLVYEAADWALERTYRYPFTSKSKLDRIKRVQEELLRVFQEP
jgi:hypothetical protein